MRKVCVTVIFLMTVTVLLMPYDDSSGLSVHCLANVFCQYFQKLLLSCTYLTISVLSLDVSALMFNSKLDNCTVSKDCEFRCFCGMDMH